MKIIKLILAGCLPNIARSNLVLDNFQHVVQGLESVQESELNGDGLTQLELPRLNFIQRRPILFMIIICSIIVAIILSILLCVYRKKREPESPVVFRRCKTGEVVDDLRFSKLNDDK